VQQPDLDTNLKNQIETKLTLLLKSASIENFWATVGLVVQYQNFGSLYWSSKEKFSEYQQIQSQARPFDFTVWQIVLSDYLNNQIHFPQINYSNLKIIFGNTDPYLNVDQDIAYWKQLFPTATCDVHHSGHYPHLEDRQLFRFTDW
jgi:hypothetical protein